MSHRVAPFALSVALVLTSGCAPLRIPLPYFGGPEKITTATVRVPRKGELPGLVGRQQQTRVRSGDTLLDVARAAGLGISELKDANPGVDEWTPPRGADIVVPSRWIPPPSRHRGVVINLPEMRLYLYPESARPGDEVEIRTWAIGIGTEETPSPIRSFTIRTKEKNPTWVVPASILKTMNPRRPIVPPGPDNPLGEYRLRLSYDIYAIHGTDTPWAVGRLTTHGCIRLYPEDIGELHDQVRVGTPGDLIYEPFKVGEENGRVYVEAHQDIYGRVRSYDRYARAQLRRAGVERRVNETMLRQVIAAKTGVPTDVTK